MRGLSRLTETVAANAAQIKAMNARVLALPATSGLRRARILDLVQEEFDLLKQRLMGWFCTGRWQLVEGPSPQAVNKGESVAGNGGDVGPNLGGDGLNGQDIDPALVEVIADRGDQRLKGQKMVSGLLICRHGLFALVRVESHQGSTSRRAGPISPSGEGVQEAAK